MVRLEQDGSARKLPSPFVERANCRCKLLFGCFG
jgi:hypothetical protein